MIASCAGIVCIITASPATVMTGTHTQTMVYLAEAALSLFVLGLYFMARWVGHGRLGAAVLITFMLTVITALVIVMHALLVAGVHHFA